MDETLVISVSRKPRPSEILLRRLMGVLGVVFLLQGIMFSSAFMLPCFLMVLCWFWYSYASKREYEYTLEDRILKIDRVSDRGRRRLYEIPFGEIRLVCAPATFRACFSLTPRVSFSASSASAPDAPEALPYKKGGSIRVKKEDFTSYREGVPYYTVIVRDTPRPLKLLLDLTPEALRLIRRWNRDAFPAADRPA